MKILLACWNGAWSLSSRRFSKSPKHKIFQMNVKNWYHKWIFRMLKIIWYEFQSRMVAINEDFDGLKIDWPMPKWSPICLRMSRQDTENLQVNYSHARRSISESGNQYCAVGYGTIRCYNYMVINTLALGNELNTLHEIIQTRYMVVNNTSSQ